MTTTMVDGVTHGFKPFQFYHDRANLQNLNMKYRLFSCYIAFPPRFCALGVFQEAEQVIY